MAPLRVAQVGGPVGAMVGGTVGAAVGAAWKFRTP